MAHLTTSVAIATREANNAAYLLKSADGTRSVPATFERDRYIDSMTLLYYDDVFLEHETGGHPENAGRLRAVTARLQEHQLDQRCTRPESWSPVTTEQLVRVHDADTIAATKAMAESGGGMLDADTIVSPRSFAVASLAAGAACDAVRRVAGGGS